jgi:predicted nucleic acid-binding protein
MRSTAKNMVVLIDTSVFLVYAYTKDSHHENATRLWTKQKGGY